MSSVEGFANLGASRNARRMLGASGVAVLVSVLQFSVIVLISLVTGLGYHALAYGTWGDVNQFTISGVLAGLAYVVPMFVRRDSGWYEAMANRRTSQQVAVDWTLAVFVVAMLAFLTKTSDQLSRGAILSLLGVGLALLLGLEVIVGRLISAALAASRAAPRRVMLLGDIDTNDRLKAELESRSDVDVVGLRSLPLTALGAGSLTDLDAVIERSVTEARHLQVDDVIFTLPLGRLDVVERCAQAFSISPVTMHMAGDELNRRFAGLKVTQVGAFKTLRLSRPALSPVQALAKRFMDIVLAAVGLLFLAPLFPFVALAIKLDSPGPVFFLQNRRGYNQRDFRIFKFRTMSTLDDGDVVVQAKKNDPRITRLGAWLRRLNIDELPQLINVLKGDMSIVGPRPHAVAHDTAFEKRIARYPRRLNVRPGITGWAQVNGFRGETDTEDKMARRVEADLYYIDNWSLGLDLRILLLTVASPRAYKNAR